MTNKSTFTVHCEIKLELVDPTHKATYNWSSTSDPQSVGQTY